MRQFFFWLKRNIILDPKINFNWSLMLGFVVALHLLISLVILYEKVRQFFIKFKILVRWKFFISISGFYSTDITANWVSYTFSIYINMAFLWGNKITVIYSLVFIICWDTYSTNCNIQLYISIAYQSQRLYDIVRR